MGYTDGHCCVTGSDKAVASYNKSSLLYGEILPAGAHTFPVRVCLCVRVPVCVLLCCVCMCVCLRLAGALDAFLPNVDTIVCSTDCCP